jgi:hypothetical protein
MEEKYSSFSMIPDSEIDSVSSNDSNKLVVAI